MTEDEKYVREQWEASAGFVAWDAEHGRIEVLDARILFPMEVGSGWKGFWSAAAEFTRTRLEELRQIEEQWVLLGAQSLEWWRAMEREEAWTNRRLFWARGYVQFMFIAARLETTLANLKRGLRVAE